MSGGAVDLRVGHWRWRHRGYGDRAAVTAATTALRGLIEGPLRDDLDAGLATALGGDPTVYVVRRLTFACSVRTRGRSAAQQTRVLARAATGALLAIVQRDDGGDGNVIRFRDQADYLAQFLADLVRGLAWARWYYRAFTRFRHAELGVTIRDVLAAHPTALAPTLAGLRRRGVLREVLDALGEEGAARLTGTAAMTATSDDRRPAIAPLFDAAVLVARRLGWMTADPGAVERLRGAYFASSSHTEDWRDVHALAQRVADAIAFLRRRGAARVPDRPVDARAIEEAVAALDWLDRPTLVAALVAGDHDDAVPSSASLPVSARQRDLLQALAEAVRASGVDADAVRRRPHGAKLRILAALSERVPDAGTADSAADALLDAVVAVACAVVAAGAAGAIAGGWGEIERRLQRAPAPAAALIAVRSLRRFGGLAMPALTAVIGRSGRPVARPDVLADATAGVFLLVRTVEDLRLPRLLAQVGVGGDGALPGDALLLLAAKWAGAQAVAATDLSRGLALWSGGTAASVAASATRWAMVPPVVLDALQIALLRAVRAPWLGDPRVMHLVAVEFDGARGWVGCSGHGRLWPLGWIGDGEREAEEVLVARWREATGVQPAVERPDDGSDLVTRVRDGVALLAGGAGPPAADLAATLVAATLLRVWATWLRGFGESSLGYLLRELVRRPGSLREEAASLSITLAPRPLDVVLATSGYLGRTGPIGWLADRRIELAIGGG